MSTETVQSSTEGHRPNKRSRTNQEGICARPRRRHQTRHQGPGIKAPATTTLLARGVERGVSTVVMPTNASLQRALHQRFMYGLHGVPLDVRPRQLLAECDFSYNATCTHRETQSEYWPACAVQGQRCTTTSDACTMRCRACACSVLDTALCARARALYAAVCASIFQ